VPRFDPEEDAVKWALVLSLLVAPGARAQVFQVSAGQSTIDGAGGGQVVSYFNGWTLTTGAGEIQAHGFRFAASAEFTYRGWDVTVGDREFSFLTGDTGFGVAERGVSMGRRTEHSTFQLFGGAVGTLFTTPFFNSFGSETMGAGMYYEHRFKHVKLQSLEAIQGMKKTALESAELSTHGLKATVNAGWLQNAREFNALAEYRPDSHFAFYAAHQVYVLPPIRSAVDTVSAASNLGIFQTYVSAFHGDYGWGETIGAGARYRWLQFNEMRAASYGEPPIWLTTASQTSRRWTLSESFTDQDGRHAFSMGAGFHSNRLTASVGQSILYNVVTGQFQQATVARLTLHVANASADVGTSVNSASRKFLYTADASDYLGEPASTRGHNTGWISKAKYEVSGRVLDSQGEPVAGAALEIGGVTTYSDNRGEFSVRFKKPHAVAVAVLLDDFAAPGRWHVVDAPLRANPGEPFIVIVVRA
jgi:hypothetical protein